MIVLGVDPGSNTTGYGLVEQIEGRLACLEWGHITSPKNTTFYSRIHHIFSSMVEIMNRYGPQELAIEDVFYAKNVKSSLKLGHARGAVLIAAVQCGLRIYEYSALEIKKAVVGYGRASKEQVRSMVKMILSLEEEPGLDSSDALAAAVCHLNWQRYDRGTRR
ncbi:MAG TPA: crossover junction endodeoxyribonuclease RuvC [Desulfobacterales bacterium]|nr:crossover junction endodeoxyribonuclease RuvC [Desulfobacterales bacterium]